MRIEAPSVRIDAPSSNLRAPHRVGRGILLMIVAVSTFACMDTIAKYLARDLPVPAIVWARYFFQMVVMLVVLGPRLGLGLVRTRIPAMQITRGIVLTCSSMVFFSALAHMPLAEASTITFLSPLLIAALAWPLLRERAPRGTWTALGCGVVGVVLIVRPGTAVFTWWALLPLATACLFATYQLMTRKMAGRDPATTTLFYPALMGSVVVPIFFPHAMTLPEEIFPAILMVTMGILGGFGHFLLIKAFETAPAPTLAPFIYFQIVTVMVLGWLVFGQFPDGWSLAGMAIIVASGLWLAFRHRPRAG